MNTLYITAMRTYDESILDSVNELRFSLIVKLMPTVKHLVGLDGTFEGG